MNSEAQAIIARWKSYLEKIEQRFNESLLQAEETCKDLLIESNYDYFEVMKTWTAINAQISKISSNVDQTWEQMVYPQLQSQSIYTIEKDLQVGHFTDNLHYKLTHFERNLHYQLSQSSYDNALKTSNKNFSCTQCHSPLTIKTNIFRAHYVTCHYCQATNTFTPDTKYAHIGGTIIDNIAAKKCEQLYQKMQLSMQKITEQRPPVAENFWDTYKTDYFAYYETFFLERIKLNEDAKQRFDADMQRKKTEYEHYENIHKKSYQQLN